MAAHVQGHPRRPPDAMRRLFDRLVVVLLVWTVYLSLYPFEPAALSAIGGKLAAGIVSFSLTDLVPHALGFGLLGAVLGARRLVEGAATPSARTLRLILVLCIALELLQVLVAGRHARLSDLIANVLFAGAGYLGVLRLEPGIGLTRRLRALGPRLPWIAAGVLALNAVGSILVRERAVSFANWGARHRLVVGEDLSGEHPWRGSIAGLAVYGHALSAAEVARLAVERFDTAAGVELRHELGAIVLYDFAEERGFVLDLAEGENVLPLSVEPPSPRPARELELHGSRRAIADLKAKKLLESLLPGAALSVEVIVTTDSLRQGGPARIATFSSDPQHRNFTLAQQGDEIVLRVRTPATPVVGDVGPAWWPGAFTDLERHHLAATYSEGVFRAYRDGEWLAPDQQSTWASPGPGRVPLLKDLWTALLLFLPLGFLGACLSEERRLALRLTGMAVVGAVLAVCGTLLGSVFFGTTFDGELVLLAALYVPAGDLLLDRGAALTAKVRRELRPRYHGPEGAQVPSMRAGERQSGGEVVVRDD